VLCGPCAITRWLRVVDLAVTRINTKVTADAIGKAVPVTPESPHLCRSTKAVDETTAAVPVFPPIDQWGALPFPLQHMTPHSLSRRVRDLLAGDLGAHRDLRVDRDTDAGADSPVHVPVERRVYSSRDAEQAWNRRRADLVSLDNVAQELADVDRRADELNRRATALVSSQVDVD